MSGVGVLILGLGIGLLIGVLVTAGVGRALGRRDQAEPEAVGAADEVDTARLQAAVLEQAPIAVLTLDSSDGVLLANRRAQDLGLLDRRGAVEPLLQIARAGRQGGEVVREIVLPTVGFPRRVIHARVRANLLPDRVVALVVEDVTEAHRVDVVRRDFVANVSHEIKTPVGAVSLLAEAALQCIDDAESSAEARHFVERISRESARLGRLVSELLDLSRLQGAEARPVPAPVHLDDVVTEAVDRATPHADARDITIVRSDPTGAVVSGVEAQLVTAVANLLDNAINYSPEATRVAVAVRQQGDTWQVTVTDQGLGIPAADQDRIFERFYRVDPARSRATGGTGLGLAIVKHVARNHDGEVRVWSSPGAGSTFTLCLPVSPAGDLRETEHADVQDTQPHDADGRRDVTASEARAQAAHGADETRPGRGTRTAR